MASLYLNSLSIIFCDWLDAQNNYFTIACNWDNEMVFEVSPFGYWILKEIMLQPGISIEQLIGDLEEKFPAYYKPRRAEFFSIVEYLRSQNIVLAEKPVDWIPQGTAHQN